MVGLISQAQQRTISMSAQRYVWCQTKGKLLLGESVPMPIEKPSLFQRILRRKYSGTLFIFSEVGLHDALNALEAFVSSPSLFSLESKEGNRIDILPLKNGRGFYLDCWLDNVDVRELDGKLLHAEQVRELVIFIYEDVSDRDIGKKIISLAATQDRILE
jgi:hypothetical protein